MTTTRLTTRSFGCSPAGHIARAQAEPVLWPWASTVPSQNCRSVRCSSVVRVLAAAFSSAVSWPKCAWRKTCCAPGKSRCMSSTSGPPHLVNIRVQCASSCLLGCTEGCMATALERNSPRFTSALSQLRNWPSDSDAVRGAPEWTTHDLNVLVAARTLALFIMWTSAVYHCRPRAAPCLESSLVASVDLDQQRHWSARNARCSAADMAAVFAGRVIMYSGASIPDCVRDCKLTKPTEACWFCV